MSIFGVFRTVRHLEALATELDRRGLISDAQHAARIHSTELLDEYEAADDTASIQFTIGPLDHVFEVRFTMGSPRQIHWLTFPFQDKGTVDDVSDLTADYVCAQLKIPYATVLA